MVALLALSGILLIATAPAANAEPTPDPLPCLDPRGCPDIIVDPVVMKPKIETQTFEEHDCDVEEGSTVPGRRRLLRFAASTPNIGDGDLLVGSPLVWPQHFFFALCHAHFHFREYGDYRLWRPTEHAEWERLRAANPNVLAEELLNDRLDLQPVSGQKQGFCLLDIEPFGNGGSPAPKYLTCDTQGISTGYTDIYGHDLSGQYVDITEVPAGTYVLEVEVNAERLYMESDYANNRAAITVRIP